MAFGTILMIAVALAVDAFAVAFAAGVSLPRLHWRHTFRLAWHFGIFQAGMTMLGWAGGLKFRPLIEDFDHWLAFFLLAVVGGRMVIAGMREDKEEQKADPTRGATLVMLSVATSIDALAVGLSFAILNIDAWHPSLVIGLVAGVLTAAGLHIGRSAGATSRLSARAEMAGGVVLIAIGVNILLEHLGPP
jgi:putative Mn2+ efflux pump MntP